MFFFHFRLWHGFTSKLYPIDVVNFGSSFIDANTFKPVFNPVYPMAALKYTSDLWIVLLPGKRRTTQGQILYRHYTTSNFWSLQSVQWSPNGRLLHLIIKTENLRKAATDCSPARGVLLMIKDFRGRFCVEEIKNGWDFLPQCENPTQLSSEI